MSAPIAFCSGKFFPATEAKIELYDLGFVQGVTVSEQLRTFRGELYRLDQHLDRLRRSFEIVGVKLSQSFAELAEIARHVARHNHALLEPDNDLGLAILVTPGPYSAFAPADAPHEPTVIIHTYPVAFSQFASKFVTGQALAVTPVRQVPSDCWPAELKCRSRMHYYLADRAARLIDPTARALLLDEDNHVTEASTANLVIYLEGEGLVSPPKEKILPGISVSVLADLATQLGYSFSYRTLTVPEVAGADEAFLTSTSPCIIPCVRLDNRPIGEGVPGPTFQRLIAAWSDLVGVDIVQQAQQFSQ